MEILYWVIDKRDEAVENICAFLLSLFAYETHSIKDGREKEVNEKIEAYIATEQWDNVHLSYQHW